MRVKVRFVSLRPTVCYSCHSVFAAENLGLSQNLEFILALLFVSCVIIWSRKTYLEPLCQSQFP